MQRWPSRPDASSSRRSGANDGDAGGTDDGAYASIAESRPSATSSRIG